MGSSSDNRNFYNSFSRIISEFLNKTKEEINKNRAKPQGYNPLLDSQGEKEIEATSAKNVLMVSYHLGDMMLELASDHLDAFSRVISEIPLLFSPFTIVRNVIEACSISSWLFDPDISPESRCNRCYAIMYMDMDEEIKLIRSLGNNRALKKIEKQKDLFVDTARNDGFKIIYNNKKIPVGIGEAYPGPTVLIRDELGIEPAFRLYSGVVHCRHGAIDRIGHYIPIQSPGGGNIYEKIVQTDLLDLLCNNSIMSYHHGLSRKFHIFGWNTNVIDDACALAQTKIEEELGKPVIGTK